MRVDSSGPAARRALSGRSDLARPPGTARYYPSAARAGTARHDHAALTPRPAGASLGQDHRELHPWEALLAAIDEAGYRELVERATATARPMAPIAHHLVSNAPHGQQTPLQAPPCCEHLFAQSTLEAEAKSRKENHKVVNRKQYVMECAYCHQRFSVDDPLQHLGQHENLGLRIPCVGSGQIGKPVIILGTDQENR